ncbi:DUF6377 domain-containing protein [Limibacter armeniacum]|uniref:DUF6377 domain-containing protein n=1 Tax=Limibacter armeniacum TaxID=466084 RepID=UPI002FE61F1E
MMRYFTNFLLFLLMLLPLFGYSQSEMDSILKVLDEELSKKEVYVNEKSSYILSLKDRVKSLESNDLQGRYDLYNRLYREYNSFHYDSAYHYLSQLKDVAFQLNDQDKILKTRLESSFILLSSGMFKEAIDSLNVLDISGKPNATKVEYYALKAKIYYGLTDYSNDNYYSPIYNKEGHQYIDSVLKYAEPDSYHFLYYRGLRSARRSDIQRGISDLRALLDCNDCNRLSYHEGAIVASTLSDIYLKIGDDEKATTLLAQAAIYDIRSSTKETAATLTLAGILHKRGNIRKAYTYARHALDDANFYGARHRKIQIGAILPILEEEKLNLVENQKELLIFYSLAITLLSVLVVVFAIVIFKQLKRIRKTERELTHTNTILNETNQKLKDANEQLMDSNKIKEKYIGYYFSVTSEYLEKIHKFKSSIENKLMEKKYDHIKVVLNNMDLRKMRLELFKNFDKIFLDLFPHFIEEFNSNFEEEDQVKLEENELLNTDLRIFALIRMGITDTDKIANILEYTVNTIYTYKTRIKKKAKTSNDEFERSIMEIKPI